MRALCVVVLAVALAACDNSRPEVETQQEGAYTFITFNHGDVSLTYVELDPSTTVVFKAPSRGGGGGGIDTKCLSCRISNISVCTNEVCPLPGGGCDSDAISKCAREKCETSGECKASLSALMGILRP